MKNALIGYTGFIGSNLKKKIKNCEYYNSKNINRIISKNYETIYCSANDARIWYANQNPFEDLLKIIKFIKILKKVKCKKFILISSIEVYNKKTLNPYNEKSKISTSTKPNYGSNRFLLELLVRKIFLNFLIIRLPVVYGEGMKKNILYDLINNNNLSKINLDDVLQFYPVKFLFNDIQILIKKKINIINLSSAPISVNDVVKKIKFSKKLNKFKKKRIYNMTSLYANFFKKINYRFDQEEILRDIKFFYYKSKKK